MTRLHKAIQILFAVAALYDGALGLLFLLAGNAPFKWFHIVPPNHPGYVQFPAALLVVFAIMFAAIARDPIKNRNLIIYGILLKISYCAVSGFHWIAGGIPTMWKPFCICDIIFIILFARAWTALRNEIATGKTISASGPPTPS